MQFEQHPLTEIQQGMLFLWMRQSLTDSQEEQLRTELPDVAFTILGPRVTHGIPDQLFRHVLALCRGNRKIEAIKELRAHLGWSLKDAKEFTDRHCS